MSHRRSSSPSHKKLPANGPSSPDSNHKMTRASSTTLYTSKARRIGEHSKSEISHNTRAQSRSDNEFHSNDSTITGRQSLQMSRATDQGKLHLNHSRSQEKSIVPEASFGDETSSDDLLVVLSKQLYVAANQMQKMQSVLKKAEDRLEAKDREIGKLRRKVKEWEAKSRNQDLMHKKEKQQRKTQIENSEYLYKRCLSLEHKIYEMEKFLADYGLVWIGESNADATKRPDDMSNDFIQRCYAQLTANIEELNLSVRKGEIQVERNQNGAGASFKTPSCMLLRFYKNGMVIDDGKLRSYSDPSTGLFIRDILDGYFPSELQKTYPNGVPFKVEDHREQTYLGKGFPGHGYRLGKQRIGIGSRPSSSSPSSNEQSKHYRHKLAPGMLSVPSSARTSKQNITSDPSSVNLLGLRSQILASHNNNCSDTHLQSHINAELGVSGRSEKKRIVATKTTEYRIAVKEGVSVCSKDTSCPSACLTSRSRTSRDGSVDRSALGSSPSLSRISRLGSSSSRIRPRPRSASVNDGRYPLGVSSGLSFVSGKNSTTRDFCNSTTGRRMTKPRMSRSATMDRKKEIPIVREINAATGKPEEFRLKVRSMSGNTVFLVHVSADDTVPWLYQLLDRVLPKGRARNYKIVVSGFERKRLDDLNISLNEYGITRNSVLHLVND